jgi:hypothetical protein
MPNKNSFLIILLLSLLTAWKPVESADNQGYIYGTITTRDGNTYTGTMRWGRQEVFWDDLFNATKESNPWAHYVSRDREERDGRYKLKVFGISIYNSFAGAHVFICRFGDIRTIKNGRRGKATIMMKNGSEYDVESGGDIDVKIRVLDENLGKFYVKWDNIKTIEFKPTPRSARTEGYRLKGTLKTFEKDFKGFIMWDAEECLSTDILDGQTDDGDMEIEFGNIRSIKRLSSRACKVTLKDGRSFRLSGTNDVNDDNRGIYVQDDRFGKIEVQWDEFREVIYEDEDGSGMAYTDFKPAKKIRGSVTTVDGEVVKGDIVFDLDESEDFEILNGKLDDMEFNIPFAMVKSITPRGGRSSVVELKNGEKLRLEDAQDVTDSNDGVLVFSGNEHQYIPWEDIETIVFK